MTPLGVVLTALRRHWLLCAAILAICLAVAGVAELLPSTYQATAFIRLASGLTSAPDADTALRNTLALSGYYIEMATSRPVLQRVIVAQHLGTTPEALRKNVKASSVLSSGLVAVSARANTAQASADLANGIAAALLDQNRVDSKQLTQSSAASLDALLSRLDAQIRDTSATTSGQPNTTSQQARLPILQSQYENAAALRLQLAIMEQRLADSVTLSANATPPAQPISPSRRYFAIALAVGGALSLLLTLLAERWQDRIHRDLNLAEATAVPFVVSVPDPSRRGAYPRWEAAHALLLAHLRASHPDASNVILVASSQDDSADIAAEDLRIAANALGRGASVVGWEADGRGSHANEPRPVFAPWRPGPSDKLQSMQANTLITGHEAPAVSVATSPSNTPLQLIGTPPPDSSPAALSLATNGDVILLIANSGVTSATQAGRTAELLRAAGVEPAGGILFEAPNKRHQVWHQAKKP